MRREDALKAAYLFNFTKFVDWPGKSDDTVLTLCFVGGVGVREALANNLASKKIGNHPVNVREVANPYEDSDCSLLYVSAASTPRPEVRAPSTRTPVLTVSDANGFAHSGGIIELFTEGNRLRFIVNMGNARRAGIRVSSALLQLASVVEKDDEQ